MIRKCFNCEKILVRREKERRPDFLARKYCDWNCSVAGRAKIAAQRRVLVDLQDSMDHSDVEYMAFDRAEIIQRAHMAAPQTPISLVVEIVDAIEPMIAANTQRKILAHVGNDVRAKRDADKEKR